ncbi:response regulator [Thalassorhabdus alkalitolerans]|uniref:Response regulator n=1 Tax=Thalassorhabdus alkalitolerans TaxID=2282697 RepID=A0ABW0YKD0_9BACI
MINVLIVEDDPMVAKFNKIYLEKINGFHAAGIVHNVKEAWKVLKQEKIDLLLLDVYMTDDTGLDMLVELRREGSNIDAIVITAANDNTSIKTALRYGAVDYLIKPFDFERFKESLLQYKKKAELMKDEQAVSQEELDAFLLRKKRSNYNPLELPKGLTEVTFAIIAKQILDWETTSFSTADVAKETGISRVSTRKYLQHLVDIEILLVQVSYQTTGRPLHRYRLKSEKKDVLQSFVASVD